MTFVAVVLGLAAVTGLLVLALKERRHSPWESKVRARVNVTTAGDTTFSGVLWEINREFLVLRDVRLLDREGEVPVDGEMIVERARVEYVQVP